MRCSINTFWGQNATWEKKPQPKIFRHLNTSALGEENSKVVPQCLIPFFLHLENYLTLRVIVRSRLCNALVIHKKHMALIQQLQNIENYYSVSIFVQVCPQQIYQKGQYKNGSKLYIFKYSVVVNLPGANIMLINRVISRDTIIF